MADVKLIRKQIQNVIQSIGPQLIAQELYKQLQKEHTERLNQIDLMVREALVKMDDRAKDVQNFLMREMMSNIQAKPVVAEPISESAAPKEGDTVAVDSLA